MQDFMEIMFEIIRIDEKFLIYLEISKKSQKTIKRHREKDPLWAWLSVTN